MKIKTLINKKGHINYYILKKVIIYFLIRILVP